MMFGKTLHLIFLFLILAFFGFFRAAIVKELLEFDEAEDGIEENL